MGRIKKLILPTLLGLAAYYAFFGGEYSLLELRRARAEIQAQQQELSLLESEVAFLRARADSLENDSATIERIASPKHAVIRLHCERGTLRVTLILASPTSAKLAGFAIAKAK